MVSYTPEQIVAFVQAGKGPAGMYAGGDAAKKLSDLHEQIAGRVSSLQSQMSEYWSGDAAGQAYAGAGPLVQASQVSGDHLQAVQNLYHGQGSSYQDLQGKVAAANLGAKPQGDWVSGTPFSFLSNRGDEIDQWNQKAQQVVDNYNVYHGQSTDNSSRWPAQANYGALGLPPSGADVKPITPGGDPRNSGSSVVGGTHGGTSNHGGSGNADGGPGSSAGNNGGPGSSNGGSPNGGSSNHGGPVSPGGPGSPQNPGGSSQLNPGGTSAAGYNPSPASSPNSPGVGGFNSGGFGSGSNGAGSNSGFGPGGGFAGGFGPGGGSAGGFGPGGGSGSAGGYGSGAGGTGSRAGNLGAGNSAGAGGASSEPAGGRAGGGSSSAARPGTSGSGAGGMGRGGKGEGDEDTEHQRPAYLLENDPDEALIGELPRTSPPVIGL
jgi:hypothetical protein